MMLESRVAREAWRDYQILTEVEKDENLSQRDLADRAGLNLAITNQVIKRLVRKGFVKTCRVNARRMAYYLTPQGFSEKIRLVMRYARYTVSFFTQVRGMLNSRLREIKREHAARSAVIIGTGELAEAVYLSLQEQGVKLAGVYSRSANGKSWFGVPVRGLDGAVEEKADVAIVTCMHPEDLALVDPGRYGRLVLNLYELLAERLVRFASAMESEDEV